MKTVQRDDWLRWAVAVGAVVAGSVARAVLWPELFRDATYLPLFGAVLFSAWYGGLAPGLLSLALGGAFLAWTIFPPLQNFAISDPQEQVGMALYLTFGCAICFACHSLHLARKRQQTILAELHEGELHRVKIQAEADQLIAEAQRKDRFLATLAHELRNPLAPMVLAIEVSRLDRRRASHALATIDRQVSHLNRLVEDLMDVSRMTRNAIELQVGIVSAMDLLAGSLEAAAPHIAHGGHALDVVEPNPAWTAKVDLVRATQVLTNLLNNAAKFTPEGGRITVEVVADEMFLAFLVTDNGIGIDPRDVDRLMQPFEQGAPAMSKARAGLGIGLPLAREIAELHGGSVTLEPAPGGTGTRATARLPRAADMAPAPTARAAAQDQQATTVLVVDDNRDAADSLAALLGLLGHTAHVAADGEEACRMADELRPRVAFIDLGMPRRDGLAACRWIREQPWGNDMVLVALTGWGQESDREQTRSAGFDLHLVKPASPEAIIQALGELSIG